MFLALLAHWRFAPIYVILLSTTDCGATHWVRGTTDHYKEGLFFLSLFPLIGCFFWIVIWGSLLLPRVGDEDETEEDETEVAATDVDATEEEDEEEENADLSQPIKISLIILAMVSVPTIASLCFSRAEVNQQHYRLVFQTTEANGVEIRYDEISEIRLITRGDRAYLICTRHDGEEVEFRYYNFAKESGDKFLEYAREKEIPIIDNRQQQN
ncbi:hypothetical protein DSM3645_10417 [Blastopirellula marina DSM 3645]|uniref:Uncharacterized protein n=1 Tax=Blastopirellula marina DSM 3645 TaxID=314230 RepID=A3ZM24_9BACT|nr:hypothetical protein DSM3645_10417 [Blastopirellula marina DSM 3645]